MFNPSYHADLVACPRIMLTSPSSSNIYLGHLPSPFSVLASCHDTQTPAWSRDPGSHMVHRWWESTFSGKSDSGLKSAVSITFSVIIWYKICWDILARSGLSIDLGGPNIDYLHKGSVAGRWNSRGCYQSSCKQRSYWCSRELSAPW